MTWLFTQVWLWSLAAFLLGSLCTWLLFVLPLKRRLNAIVAEYAHRPPPYGSQPGDYYEPESTALDLFEPQRPAAGSVNGAGGTLQVEFPGPGRWEPFEAAAGREGHDDAVTEISPVVGMHGLPAASEAVAPEPAPAQTIEVNGPNTWFDGAAPDETTQMPPVAVPANQTGQDGTSTGQDGHRVPPYVPPSDPEITQVIPRIAEDPDGGDAPVAPGEQYVIKGHFASRQYHTPDSPQYDHIVAEVWFRTVEDAEQAGFESWNTRTR